MAAGFTSCHPDLEALMKVDEYKVLTSLRNVAAHLHSTAAEYVLSFLFNCIKPYIPSLTMHKRSVKGHSITYIP